LEIASGRPRCPWTLLSKTAGCPGGCNRQCCTLIECIHWETWGTDEAAANDARCTALRLQLTAESDGNSDWNREIYPSINYGKNNTSCAELHRVCAAMGMRVGSKTPQALLTELKRLKPGLNLAEIACIDSWLQDAEDSDIEEQLELRDITAGGNPRPQLKARLLKE